MIEKPAALRAPGRLSRRAKNEAMWAYIFIFPMLFGIIIFSIWPIIQSFYISFTDWNGLSSANFIGFDNFRTLWEDEKIRMEFRNTAIFTIFSVPITMILSLLVANWLNQGLRSTGIFRVIYFMPNVMMPVAVAMVWRWLLHSKLGLVNTVLRALGIAAPMWISDPQFILTSIIIVSIWSGIGYNAVILLAGLQSIPTSLYEAADIDGASEWVKFIHIRIPMLTPSIFFLLTMSIMNAIRVFDVVYTFTGAGVTQAGPLMDASRTIVYGIFEKAFSFFKMGLASAESVVLFIIICIVTAIQFKLQDKWVFYE